MTSTLKLEPDSTKAIIADYFQVKSLESQLFEYFFTSFVC